MKQTLAFVVVFFLGVGSALGAIAIGHKVRVQNSVAMDNAVLLQVKTRIETLQCAAAQAEAGAASCKLHKGDVTSILWGDDTDPTDKAEVTSEFAFSGQFTAD